MEYGDSEHLGGSMGEPSLTFANAVILWKRGSAQTLVSSSGQGLCWRRCLLCRSLGNGVLASSGCWQAIPSSMEIHFATFCHSSGCNMS